jgi:hypothetical protein
MEEITRKFFLLNEECPCEIEDCASLRNEYIETLDALKRQGGCSSCAERRLRNSFIERIKKSIK